MRNILILCAGMALSVSAAQAADVTVQWQNVEKFTDIRPANDSRKSYRERVMKKFDGFFQQLAAELPEGYSWQLTVTDIDLAGDVDYFIGGAGNALRIVKEIYSPAIRFTHTLRDKHGEEVLSAEEKLRDMGFMHSVRSTNVNEEFHYEQQMLQDWFNKELQPKVEQYANALPKVSGGE
jgi:opacity protein-like surface antigen